MNKIKDITGKKYGYLTAIKFISHKKQQLKHLFPEVFNG